MKETEEKKYYYLDKERGRTEGPYALEELRAEMSRDSHLATAPVSREGAAGWRSMESVLATSGANLEAQAKAPSLWARIFKRKSEA